MSIYDIAYEAMENTQDIDTALACARKYFAGEHSDNPIWEYLSAGKAVAVKDITDVVRK